MSSLKISGSGFNAFFAKTEAVGLLRECREVTIRQLSAALVRMMGKVDDALFELALVD